MPFASNSASKTLSTSLFFLLLQMKALSVAADVGLDDDRIFIHIFHKGTLYTTMTCSGRRCNVTRVMGAGVSTV